jgi:hypothetical protein
MVLTGWIVDIDFHVISGDLSGPELYDRWQPDRIRAIEGSVARHDDLSIPGK